jgi:hypothetical protein
LPRERLDSVSRRPNLTHITHETRRAVETNITHNVREELTTFSHERAVMVFFIFTWGFTDQRDPIEIRFNDGVLIGNDTTVDNNRWERYSWFGCNLFHIRFSIWFL